MWNFIYVATHAHTIKSLFLNLQLFYNYTHSTDLIIWNQHLNVCI